jgi:hypothetical protein
MAQTCLRSLFNSWLSEATSKSVVGEWVSLAGQVWSRAVTEPAFFTEDV